MRSVVFVLILLILTGCHSSPPATKSTLRFSFSTHPATVDPRKSGDFISSTLISLLFAGLTRCKSGSEIELSLAEKVEISPDQKTYLFTLRKSLWSDGHPVTAYDFEKSWKAVLSPGFPSLCAYLFYPIKNGERCAKGLLPMEEVGIRALNAYTLQVELEHPTPYFLSLTAFPLYLPVPHHLDDPFSDWCQNPAKLICNGPFCIGHILPNTEIALKKNPSFWDPSLVHLDEIQISIVPDETTALQMFERDELDLVGGFLAPLPSDALQTLQENPNLRFIPMTASTFCTFNTESFPFSNRSLRKAFASAIDCDLIKDEIAKRGQIPATRCLPPSLCSSPDPSPTRGVAQLYLQQALKELQIDPSALESMTLFFKAGQTDKWLAQALQRQWKDVLGIEIHLEQADPKAHLQRLYKRNYQIALSSWIAQYHDSINILERFKDKKNVKNYPGWESERYVQLLEEAGSTLDVGKRLHILENAEAMLAEETIIAPLYHWRVPTLLHPRVQNLEETSSGGVLFEWCSVSP